LLLLLLCVDELNNQALLHGDRDPSIAGMVLDSPFTDLSQLARELVETARSEGYSVPGFVVSAAMAWIGSQVKSRAGFDIKDLAPIDHAEMTFIPALFGHGREDEFIQPHHSQQIHDKYAGDKNIILFDGDHGVSFD
jgi:acetyl esterase/lipase